MVGSTSKLTMYVTLSIAILFTFSATTAYAAPTQCAATGNYYEFLPISNTIKSWSNANAEAQALSFTINSISIPGHLVTITSQAEQDCVDLLVGSDRAYIGLTDVSFEGTFVWVTGEPLSYTNWLAGEPNGGTTENHAELNAFGAKKWNDVSDDDHNHHSLSYVVEYDTYPNLVVSAMTHSPAEPTTADLMTFTTTVTNTGTGTSPESTLMFKIGGETPGTPATLFTVPSLTPGESFVATRTLTLSVAQGYINTATADYNNDVVESEESDNTSTHSFVVTLGDTTPPTITAARAAGSEANANGWNNAAITITYTCTDNDSGVNATASDLSYDVLSTEGAGQSATGTCVDNAGNSADATINDINIDLTAPTITAARAAGSEANTNGWNNATVTVTYSAADALSGIDAAASDFADDVLSTEGAAQSATGTVTDLAGNSADATINDINIDLTAPTITANIPTPDGLTDVLGNNWYVTNPTVTFTCSDVISGVLDCQADELFTNDNPDQTFLGALVTDLAGNTATVDVVDIDVDTTPPVITVNVDPNDPYEAGTPYTDAGATATDNLGIVTSLTDDSVDIITEFPATLTVTYTAIDPAGNTSQDSRTVIVRDTTPPVLIFKIHGADRVEADELQQGNFQFNATASDLPRTTLPLVTCVDEDTVTHLDVAGGQNLVQVTFGLGITTVTCTADDGSNISPEDPTDPADVDTDSSSNDFIVSEIFLDEITNTTPKWDESLTVTGTVYGFLPGEHVNATFGTDAIDVIVPITGTDPDAGFVWEATHAFSKETSTTIQTIFAELVENPLYATSDSQDVTITKHPTQIIMTSPDIADGQIWGLEVTKSGSVVDTFYDSNPVIPGATVTFGNTGQGEFPFSLVALDGTFSETARTHLLTAPSGVTLSIDALFVDDFEDIPTVQFYESASTINDDYTTISHSTEITLDDIASVPAGTSITVTGTLFDTSLNPPEGLGDKQLTLTPVISNNPENNPEASVIIDDETAISVSHPIEISGNFEVTLDKILRLDTDDVLMFDSNPRFVVLTLTDMGNNEVEFLVTGPGMQLNTIANGQNLNDGKFTLEGNSGISRIEITSVSGTGTIGISKIDLVNSADTSIFDSDDDLGAKDSRVYTSDEDFFLGEGNYDTIGTTGSGESYTIEVTADFDGDANYDASLLSPTKSVTLGSNAGASNSGGGVTSITADAGIGILSISCTTDTDKDALCDEWESTGSGSGSGIPYEVNDATYYYSLPGTSTETPDLLLEIDSMVPHTPLKASIDAVVAAFETNGVNVIVTSLTSTDETIPHKDLLNVWKDDDNDFTNDFNSIKSRFFGDSTERVILGGTQSQNFGTQQLLLSFDGDVLDHSGNNNNDNDVVGSTTFVPGIDARAFNFDGSTIINQGSISSWPQLHDGSSYSLTFWIKSSDISNTPVILDTSNGGSKSAVGVTLFTRADGKINFQVTNGAGTGFVFSLISPPGAFKDDGEWHHYALTFDDSLPSNNAKLYVDGIQQDQRTALEAPSSSSQNKILTIGGLTGSNKLIGDMDDFRIYDHALDGNQLVNIFNSAVPDPITGYLFENESLIEDGFGENDGDVSGSMIFVDGIDGNAFGFDKSTVINQGTSSTWKLLNGDSPFSISAWIKSSDISNTPVLFDTSNGGSKSAVGMTLFTRADGKINFQVTNGAGTGFVTSLVSSPGAFKDDGEWHHYVVTWDNTLASDNAKLYVDNELVQVKSKSETASVSDHKKLLTIGGLTGSNKLIGDMDDVGIYDFALDDDQISALTETDTLLNSIVRISGITLTTPPNSATSPADSTEGTLTLNLKVTTAEPSTLSEDPFRVATVSGTDLTFDTPKVSTAITLEPNVHSLTVTVPYSTTGIVTDGDIGTITIPLKSSSFITDVQTSVGSPKTSTTLLDAKAQAYRYVMFVHSIGGSSGQAELRGNDAIVALGDGFSDSVVGHEGSIGSQSEQSGTLMHEIGHMLNLQHGGPRYLLSDPNTTLNTAAQNCVPIQDSIMGYTGQFSTYKGTDWNLDFASESGVTLNENTLTPGVTLTQTGNIVWATPSTDLQTFLKGPADGTSLDWNGDGVIDVSDTSASYDLNDYGISGCKASPGTVFEAHDEWSNLDFDFRQGPTGQFDGGELTSKLFKQQVLATLVTDIIPPLKLDGSDEINAGSTLPLKFTLHENTIEADSFVADNISAIVVKEGCLTAADGCPDGIYENLGFFTYQETSQQYHLNWNTDKDEVGIFGIKYVLPNPGADPEFITLIDSSNPIFFRVNGELVSISFESIDNIVKGKGKE
ncbi:LamG-like jellyroll fold domain-containing protein [Candidatus Nitrosopumilus sediminis]|uniref:C-type lectin domain-containing protein n=1 Tax=Candidatus Nitrosopumilus sediminis TaxID=1229909 RepID=K0BDH3_9ARCH|nr:LamG-like jellyroll fold domain-containing protein [Candidatus Nitrosopumilus sediminis]AFS83504.1 hypothetical protein NSED_08560 [Candidatus Nitrosopumilus sediminis]